MWQIWRDNEVYAVYDSLEIAEMQLDYFVNFDVDQEHTWALMPKPDQKE